MHLRALALVAAVVAAGFVVPSPASAAVPSPRVSPAQPILNQSFTLAGTVSPRFARPVQLQRWLDGAWRPARTTRSTSSGAYTFSYVSGSASLTLRTYVPRARHRGHTYSAQTSPKLSVKPVRQQLALAVAETPDGRLSAAVTFTPPVAGRTVAVQHRVGTDWVTDATAPLPAPGQTSLTFAAPDPGPQTFRAVVTGAGVPAVTSSDVAFDVPRHRAVCRATTSSSPSTDTPEPTAGAEPLPRIDVTTTDGQPVTSHSEYATATISIDPRGSNLPGTTAPVPTRMRIRGNSTAWISTKYSYKVKLDAKTSVLGMSASRDWVLLANFYDRSMLRGEVAFEIARRLGMPWTPRMRFAELWLDGSYRGLYQYGQGVEAQSGRVVLPEGGQLLEADGWDDDDIEFETTRGLDVFFKDPEAPSAEAQARIVDQVQAVEDRLYAPDFASTLDGYDTYVDVDSFVDWYIVNETMKNIDSAFQNSVFMVMRPDGCLSMGPVWDVDQSSGNRSIWGVDDPTGWFVRTVWWDPEHPRTSPTQLKGPEGHWLNRLLADPAFVAKVEARWKAVSLDSVPATIDRLAAMTSGAAERNFAVGDGGAGLPIGPTFLDSAPPEGTHVYSPERTWAGEVALLRGWMTRRIAWMDTQLGR